MRYSTITGAVPYILFFFFFCMYTQTSDVFCVGCHYKMHVTYGSGNAQAARGIFMAEVNTSFSTAIPNRSADMGSQHVEPPCE